MDVKTIGYEIVDWIHLDQKRDEGRALVNMVLMFQTGNLLTSWVIIRCEGPYCMGLVTYN